MILVVGATGLLGGAIALQLLDEGEDVRFLLRPNSAARQLAEQGQATDPDKLTAAGARPMLGDLCDRASLDKALRGVDVVISTANSATRSGPDTVQAVDRAGNAALIEAAKSAGVSQFIFVSLLGADPSSPVPFVAAKGATEQRLIESGLNYTILAPDAFMDFWVGAIVGLPALQGQPIPIFGSGRRQHSFIAARDVGAFAVAAVDHPAAVRRRIALGGPAALSYLEIVEVYARVLGRPLELQQMQPGDSILGVPEAVIPLALALDAYDSIVPMEEIARAFAVRLTSVEEFAHAQAAQSLAAFAASKH